LKGHFIRIKSVQSKNDLNRFINFPYLLHHSLDNWIPPLRNEQKKVFNPNKNKFLEHCDYELFLLFKENEVVGRVAVFINKIANEHWKDSIGFFGHYECANNPEAANVLLTTAEQWLRDRGMRVIWGPWNFITQDFGLTIEGFDLLPIILSSYNPPYYVNQITDYGFDKIKDMWVYNCDVDKGYVIPPRFLDFTDKIQKRYQVTVRQVNLKNLVEDTRIIVRLTNASLENNWGFYPIAEEEAEDIAVDLKSIIHPEAVLIAEINNQPIGYLL